MSAFPLIIYAKHGMLLEPALLVTRDITFKMENAFTATAPISHKIWDVKHGTGISKFVMNALINGITRKEPDVSLETHCVKLPMITVPVLIAIKDMI